MIDALKKAIEERDNYIKNTPGAAEYQEKIDRRLEGTTNPIERSLIIVHMLAECQSRLANTVKDTLKTKTTKLRLVK